MSQKNVSLTTGCLIVLMVIAVMAPGAPPRGKKRSADAASRVAEGHTLFLTNCSPCHGADAEGDDGPSLHHKNLPDPLIATVVKSGFPGEMPPFGSKLKAPEVKALTAYIHSLQR